MKPEFGITKEIKKEEWTEVHIDTDKAEFRGIKWQELGAFGRRKFENLLVLSRPTERLKLFYKR